MVAKQWIAQHANPARAARRKVSATEPIVAVSVVAACVALVALGCPLAAAPAVASSAGLAGVNVARRLQNREEER